MSFFLGKERKRERERERETETERQRQREGGGQKNKLVSVIIFKAKFYHEKKHFFQT